MGASRVLRPRTVILVLTVVVAALWCLEAAAMLLRRMQEMRGALACSTFTSTLAVVSKRRLQRVEEMAREVKPRASFALPDQEQLKRRELTTEEGFWRVHERYSEKQFKARYRLSPIAFRKVVEFLRPLLEPQRGDGLGGI